MNRKALRPGLALPAFLGLTLACDQGGTWVAPSLDLGGGYRAAFDPSGGFAITLGGRVVVASVPGTPLLERTPDPQAPDAWHDPTQPHPDLAAVPVDGSTLSLQSVDDGSGVRALHLVVPDQPDDTALLTLTLAAGDGFLTGLGEQYAHVSARGRVSPMFLTLGGGTESNLNDVHVPVPWLVSSRGWGLFVASREAGAFDVDRTIPGAVRVTFEGRALDVWLFVGADPLALVARYNRLAGLPRPLPRWALSPIHWRHWASADDVLSIAGEYRRRHIPSSALWFDDGWQTGLNTFEMSSAIFGDVPSMMSALAAAGFRTLAWSTPYLQQPQGAPSNEAQQLYEQAAGRHLLVRDLSGRVYVSPATPIPGGAGIVDFTNPDAVTFWEALVARGTQTGLHGFKCDYGEELIPNLARVRNPVAFADGTTSRTARLYPIQEHAAYHAALDAAYPGDGLIIARASSYGGAAQADVIWPGDLDSGFTRYGDPIGASTSVGGLPAAVVAAQTLSASGFPAFGSDTAGYRGQPTEESLRRWMEHTALSVVMQVYEDGDTRLPWAVSAAAGDEYAAMARLHQQLEPYLAAIMTAAQASGAPPLRPLPLVFPADPGAPARADDEYLLGPDLLVAPVVDAGVTMRTVHLPPGRWVHWWTDRVLDGPADVAIPAPLGQPPLFARAGGLVPMLPPDIDTLVDATSPGVVTLASRASEVLARAWAAGTSQIALDDGARIELSDGAQGVTVSWTAGSSAHDLTLDVDTRVRGSGGAAVTTAQGLGGTTLAAAASVGAVQGASSPAWAVAGGHAWLRLPGSGKAVLR